MPKKKLLIVTSVFEIPEVKLPELKIPKSFWGEEKPKKTKCKRK